MTPQVRIALLLMTSALLTAAAGAQPSTQSAAPQSPTPSAAAPVKPVADWPCWRGPYRNGITASPRKWAATWPAEGPKKLWSVKLGIGYSSPVIAGGKVYIGGYGDPKKGGKRDWDTLYCLNADTGEIVWQQPLLSAAKWVYQASTPLVDGQVVYALSCAGGAGAFDAQTGKPIWTCDLTQEGAKPIGHRPWSATPLLEGNLLVYNGGAKGLALDKTTGKVAWKSDPPSPPKGQPPATQPGQYDPATPFPGPVPIDIDGKHLVLMLTGTSFVAVNPADGTVVYGGGRKEISWNITSDDQYADPVVSGHDIELSGNWLHLQDGKIVFDKDGTKNRNYSIATFCQPILYQGCIYGSHALGKNNSTTKLQEFSYRCRDWATGQVKWEQVGLAGVHIMVDDKLLILNIDGNLVVAQATPEKYIELARTLVFPGYKDGDQGSHCLVAPAFADGRVYLRKNDTVVCLDLRQE